MVIEQFAKIFIPVEHVNSTRDRDHDTFFYYLSYNISQIK